MIRTEGLYPEVKIVENALLLNIMQKKDPENKEAYNHPLKINSEHTNDFNMSVLQR